MLRLLLTFLWNTLCIQLSSLWRIRTFSTRDFHFCSTIFFLVFLRECFKDQQRITIRGSIHHWLKNRSYLIALKMIYVWIYFRHWTILLTFNQVLLNGFDSCCLVHTIILTVRHWFSLFERIERLVGLLLFMRRLRIDWLIWRAFQNLNLSCNSELQQVLVDG